MTSIESILDAAHRTSGSTAIYDAWNAVVTYIPEWDRLVVAQRLADAMAHGWSDHL